ncbi:hypothetical protein BC830DRAFT_1100093 [Chytriomyces sp. MP71]|nr:hypothetical protein BC830DRAFT_1100093 [Chytriomyces sp. MP71]
MTSQASDSISIARAPVIPFQNFLHASSSSSSPLSQLRATVVALAAERVPRHEAAATRLIFSPRALHPVAQFPETEAWSLRMPVLEAMPLLARPAEAEWDERRNGGDTDDTWTRLLAEVGDGDEGLERVVGLALMLVTGRGEVRVTRAENVAPAAD